MVVVKVTMYLVILGAFQLVFFLFFSSITLQSFYFKLSHSPETGPRRSRAFGQLKTQALL